MAMTRFQRGVKRCLDIGFTLASTLALFPLAFLVGALIVLTSAGPILHRAERIGRDRRRFTLYKFRTMVRNADRLGPAVTTRGDPRVTPLGRLLRTTKFDEFPQVINVLRGEMSIVGPRPEAPEFERYYSGEYRKVFWVKPGLTSLAQVVFRDEETVLPSEDAMAYYVRELLPGKLELDLYYVEHWSLGLDLRVFVLGVLALVRIRPPGALWPMKDGRRLAQRTSGPGS